MSNRLSGNALIDRAFAIAIMGHAGQTDKTGKPFLFHLIRVMQRVNTAEEQTTALLHDLFEKSHLAIDTLKQEGIPDDIIEAVQLLTHDAEVPYRDYIERLKQNLLARSVKLADLEDNISTFKFKVQRGEATPDQAQKYFEALKVLGS
ncbi:MAG: hypothetical protein SGI71_07025 [Verrucomicrobiota bacterium]|nr:hypothetical protein [Verrucomicrobiota bacterium]